MRAYAPTFIYSRVMAMHPRLSTDLTYGDRKANSELVKSTAAGFAAFEQGLVRVFIHMAGIK